MLNAANETAAPRTGPRQPQARDAKQTQTGFSSLVDDNAAAKTDAARDRPAREADQTSRASASQRNRDIREQDDRAPRDTDRAATSDDAPVAEQIAFGRPEKSQDKTSKADKVDGGTTDQPNTEQAVPAASPAFDPTVALAAVAPVEPVAVAVPVIAATPVVAQSSPAPLTIAAAGIAAAKAMTTKTTATPAATDATDEAAVEASAAGGEVATAPAAAGKPKAATTEAVEIKVETGFAKPAETSTPEAAKPDGFAPVGVRTEAKTDAPKEADTGEAKPSDAKIAGEAKPPPAHAAAHEQRAAASQPAASIDATPTAPQQAQLQPAVHAAAASAIVQLTATVATAAPVPLNGLAVELAARAQSGASRFDIRLDPAELGRIDVRIDIDRNGQVTSHLTVEKPETLAMLRQDSPQLQRALNEAGLKTADGALQFALGDQSQPRQNSDGGERQAQRLIIRDDEPLSSVTPVRGYGRMFAARSGVDISV